MGLCGFFCRKFVNMWKKGNQKDMLYIKLGFEVQFGSFVKVKKKGERRVCEC